MGGANVTSCTRNKYTALHYAVKSASCETVKILVEAGAALDVKTAFGSTPFSMAYRKENAKTIFLLASLGCDLHLHHSFGCETLPPKVKRLARTALKELEVIREVLNKFFPQITTEEIIEFTHHELN